MRAPEGGDGGRLVGGVLVGAGEACAGGASVLVIVRRDLMAEWKWAGKA